MLEQGKIRECRSDSDCTKLAKPGIVYRHTGPKANQTTTLNNTSETNILTQVSPEPGTYTCGGYSIC